MIRTYRIEFDKEDDIYIARCMEIPWLTAHGGSPDEAKRKAEENLEGLRCENCGAYPGEVLDGGSGKETK